MTDITTRHIRYDWPEWIDWHNQKSVKTMCGRRSRPGLCGVPGITQQSETVEKNGRKVWGWCTNCVAETFPYYLPPGLDLDVTAPEIIDLHVRARAAIWSQYIWHLKTKLKKAREQNRLQAVFVLEEMIEELTAL